MKRRQHSVTWRAEVLGMAKVDGVPKTAKHFHVHPSVIYRWRKKAAKVPESFKQGLKDIQAGRETGGTWMEPDKWQVTTSVHDIPNTLEAKLRYTSHQIDYIRSLQAEIGRLHMLLCAEKP